MPHVPDLIATLTTMRTDTDQAIELGHTLQEHCIARVELYTTTYQHAGRLGGRLIGPDAVDAAIETAERARDDVSGPDEHLESWAEALGALRAPLEAATAATGTVAARSLTNKQLFADGAVAVGRALTVLDLRRSELARKAEAVRGLPGATHPEARRRLVDLKAWAERNVRTEDDLFEPFTEWWFTQFQQSPVSLPSSPLPSFYQALRCLSPGPQTVVDLTSVILATN